MDALRVHQEQETQLLRKIASLRSDRDDVAAPASDVVLFTAQLIRHRISAALLTSTLAAT